jgi:hypothetical protein
MTDAALGYQTEGLDNRLEEVRASVAGQAADSRLARILQEVMLRLLTLLTALLKDFRAGKLASPAPSACEAGAADAAGCDGVAGGRPMPASPDRAGAGWFGWWRSDTSPRPPGSSPGAMPHSPQSGEADLRASGADCAAAYRPRPPSRSRGEGGSEDGGDGAIAAPSPSLSLQGLQGRGIQTKGADGAIAYPPPRPSPSGPIALCAMGARSRGEGGEGANGVVGEQEGDPALVRARAPRIPPSPACAGGGGIRATAQLL